MQYTDRFGNNIRNDGGPGSGPQGGRASFNTKEYRLKRMELHKKLEAARSNWRNGIGDSGPLIKASLAYSDHVKPESDLAMQEFDK